MMQGIEVSFTQFIDFTLKRGQSKISKVKQIRSKEYDAAYDFWRELKEGLCFQLSTGASVDSLDEVVGRTNENKRYHYEEAVGQYKRFCRGKELEWFEPDAASWQFGRLTVRATPDLGLGINGQRYLIKLYFKEATQKLQKRTAAAALALMAAAADTAKEQRKNTIYGMLNLKKAALYPMTPEQLNDDLLLLLEGEAAHFVHLWEHLESREALQRML